MDPRRWESIQAAFDELVSLDQGGRATRLALLGASDPNLRAVVESLVGDAEADARLAPLEAPFLSPAPMPDFLGLAGRTVSHFRVLEPLGAGGMGVVYRAEDTRLGRAVALKFLHPHFALDDSAKKRFFREARSAAALDHPNLCTIYEVGESDNGRLFLAMALYSGKTLKAWLERDGPVPLSDAVEIARQIAQGLGCAHAAGIVHRDLKPGNVMVQPDGTVKILDFGLARSREEGHSGASAGWGTAAYMSPEQVRGHAVDARADLWALGVVLYEMVTGRRPFGERHDATVARAILEEDPDRPSTVRAEVPAQLEHVILTLLEKEPSRRLASASSVLDGLATGTRTGVPRRGRRIRRGVFVSVASAVAVVSVAAGVWLSRRPIKDPAEPVSPTRIAVFPFRVPGRAEFADLSEGLMDLVGRSLDGAGELHSVDPNVLMSRLRSEGGTGVPALEAARRLTQALGAGHFVLGQIVDLRGRVQLSASLYSLSNRAEPEAVSTYEGQLKDLGNLVDSVAHDLLTKLPAAQGMFSFQTEGSTSSYAALRDYVRGVALMRRVMPDSAAVPLESAVRLDSTFASAWLLLAESRSYEGTDVGRMLATWDRAYQLRDRLSPRERAWLLTGYSYAHGDGPAAEKAAAAMVNAYPDAAVAWYYLGGSRSWYAWQLGRPVSEADSATARALKLDPQNRLVQNELSLMRYAGGRKAEADSLWLKAFGGPIVPPEDSAGRRQFFAWLESRSRSELINILWLIPEMTDSLGDAARVVALLTDATRGPESDPGVGHHLAAWVDVAGGRWSTADSEFSRAAALDARMGVVERAWMGAMSPFARDTSWLRQTRAALRTWVPPRGPNTQYLLDWRLSPWQAQYAKTYALGLLSARLGDGEAVSRYAAQLDAIRDPHDSVGLFRDLALEVRALDAAERGDWGTSLQFLERAGLRGAAPVASDQSGPFTLRAFGRFLRAEALFHLGRYQESLGWYGTFWLHTEFVLFAPVQLREGEIYERQGDPAQAVAHYRRFLARWQEGDSQYQPLVRDVAARVARLTREPSLQAVLGSRSASTVRRIAVLPLHNLTGDPSRGYFVDGVHEAIVDALAKIEAVSVISRTSVLRFRDAERSSLPDIAKQLGVDAVVEGSVFQAGDSVRVAIQLIDGRTDQHLWSETYLRDVHDVFRLYGDLATDVAGQISATVSSEERARLVNAPQVDPEAYTLSLKGSHECLLWNEGNPQTKESYQRGIQLLRKAVDRDATYAVAYANLAGCYLDMSYFGLMPDSEASLLAQAANQRAFQLDSTLGEAYLNRGWIRFVYDHDRDGSDQDFHRAVELSPGDVRTRQWYADYLMATGRFDEAIDQKRKAVMLDPLSVESSIGLGGAYFHARRYDDAIAQFKVTVRMAPGSVGARMQLAWNYSLKGMHEVAVAECDSALTFAPHSEKDRIDTCGWVYARAGRRSQVLELLRRTSACDYEVFAALGELDRALECIRRRARENPQELALENFDPRLDPLRSDARSLAQLRKLGIN
jgi:serine/threonine protein kinase/tetratricopeptide (TPR) repeat protein